MRNMQEFLAKLIKMLLIVINNCFILCNTHATLMVCIILETKIKISIYFEFHSLVHVRYSDVYNEDNRKYLIYFEIDYIVRKLGSDERKSNLKEKNRLLMKEWNLRKKPKKKQNKKIVSL